MTAGDVALKTHSLTCNTVNSELNATETKSITSKRGREREGIYYVLCIKRRNLHISNYDQTVKYPT